MSETSLPDLVALLQRTPRSFDALLRELPGTWTQRNEGGDTWTAFDVIGHLVHGERTDWMPRIHCILQEGDRVAFEPFDRFAQKRESEGKFLPELLDEFAALRARNVTELQSLKLTPEDLTRRGRHPALGIVTLGNLLATWAAHDMTHLHQVARILAFQQRDAVGPWSKFLGVLLCSGHSS